MTLAEALAAEAQHVATLGRCATRLRELRSSGAEVTRQLELEAEAAGEALEDLWKHWPRDSAKELPE